MGAKLLLAGCLVVGVLVAATQTLSPPPGSSATHVSAAIDYHNKAAAVANNSGASGVVSPVSQADWNTIYSYDEKALAEARQADIAGMNKYYPGFGDHFQNEFTAGLQLIVQDGNNSSRGADFIRGQLLVHQFGDWFMANEDAIRNKR